LQFDVFPLSLHDALPISGSRGASGAFFHELGAGFLFAGLDDCRARGTPWASSAKRERPHRPPAVRKIFSPWTGFGAHWLLSANIDRKSTRLNSSHRTISY